MSPRRTIDSFRRDTARRLRADATSPEVRLWRHLRRSELLGSHFRRQVPIGHYVADFACMAARLVIELDGSQHGLEANKARDEQRTRWLEREGYRVIRFWNNDVSENIDGVLETIHAALYGSRDADAVELKHERWVKDDVAAHPAPARRARRPSPSRGG
jgi:very-short-patch-repair endonuclease